MDSYGENKMKFEELKLRPELLRSVKELGFAETTEIQEKCIPVIMSGKDIVGQSQTGSGKTAAFGLPMLNTLNAGNGVQAIILTPTRELCVQVYDALKSFSKYTYTRIACVYGGVSIGPQIDDLKRADIVVGTPGRTLDHLDRRSLSLDKVKYFVLDEADKMLEMGFIDDIRTILKHTPRDRQSLMFSATIPTQIKGIIAQHFHNPVYIKGQARVDVGFLRQVYYSIQPNEKFSLLVHLLKAEHGISLIFCATRQEVDLVASNLTNNGVKALAIHGGLTQAKRLHVVDMLKKEHVRIVVATDVAARGLDIRNITHVFNYDLPKTADEYIHRIGRTARAGEKGDAITLLTHADYDKFGKIQSDRTLKIERLEPPRFPIILFRRMQERPSFGRPHQGRNFTNRESRPSGGFRSQGRNDREGRGDGRSRFGSEGGSRGSDNRNSRSSGSRFGSRDRR
jgi:ATP-dependent RNA helicase DeaD